MLKLNVHENDYSLISAGLAHATTRKIFHDEFALWVNICRDRRGNYNGA